MHGPYSEIAQLLARVRTRWRRLTALRAAAVASLAVSAVLAFGLATAYAAGRSAHALAAVGVITGVVALAVAIRLLAPLRHVPSDRQLARFIEEREPSLDDRLVSAVDVAGQNADRPIPALAAAMMTDAGGRAARVDAADVIDSGQIKRVTWRVAAAFLLLLSIGIAGRQTARRSFDALSLSLFPARVQLEVTPGDARVQAGSTVAISARLSGNTAPVTAQLQRAEGETWAAIDMPADADGTFRLSFDAIGDSFTYRVVAGAITSDAFDITVVRPPRVTRVDVEYRFPPALGLEPRIDEDSGDIYAPAGTDVRLIVHTDTPAASGQMVLGSGNPVALTAAADSRLEAALRIERDDAYRLRVEDREGLSAPGETEYFIRMLDDRPPDVRILRPARDRQVTALEEVDIEAEANDDFGVAALELVYTVRGGTERVVPFRLAARAQTVSGAQTLYLEDLKVRAGDFISYYVRARDLPRGRRSSEARSDMFFLEVKPFEQEFSLAQSQGGGGGSGSPQIDDLVDAQKEVIVATWKLDRRSLASGSSSPDDIRAVGKAEAELKTRVEATASQFRDSSMRDPRRRSTPPGAPRPGQTMPEEDAMTAASKAMGLAVSALESLKTHNAMPAELEALNHLLRAQAEVKRREVSRQTGASGQGQNRQAQDLSSLFDKQLAREQQTNYETPDSAEAQNDPGEDDVLDKIRELAQRQDELLRKQQELARQKDQLTPEQMKRALAMLTRDQQALRQQADEMARQMTGGQPGDPSESQQPGQQPQGSPRQQGRQGEQGQQGQQGRNQPGQSGPPGQAEPPQASGQGEQAGQSARQGQDPSGRTQSEDERGRRMREVSDEMRRAASDLDRQDATGASARSGRALQGLRDLERQLQAGRPDEQRRAIGDMQLEARQLADAQRQLSNDLGRVGEGDAGGDTMRRLAGEQERLAERAERLRRNMNQQGAGGPAPLPKRNGRTGTAPQQAADAQRAVSEAAKDMQRQRVIERMQQSAEQLRDAAAKGSTGSRPGAGGPQQDLANALDRLADRLASATGPSDPDSQKLTNQLARAQEARERIERLGRELEKLGARPNTAATPGREGQGAPNAPPSGPEGRNQAGQPGPGGQPGESASPGPGAPRSGDGDQEAARLRDEYTRELQAAKKLLDELQRDGNQSRGGRGVTFEGPGMVLSAPGTEAFKQDFAKWEALRRQTTLALEQAESNLSRQLQAKTAKDRVAAGVDDRAPASYSDQVDSYFKALAAPAAKKAR